MRARLPDETMAAVVAAPRRRVPLGDSRLAARLRREVEGEVLFGRADRGRQTRGQADDSENYPRSENDPAENHPDGR